jgi:hypothetical protein
VIRQQYFTPTANRTLLLTVTKVVYRDLNLCPILSNISLILYLLDPQLESNAHTQGVAAAILGS